MAHEKGRPRDIIGDRQRIILDLPPELVKALDLVAERGRSDYLIALLTTQQGIQQVLNKELPVSLYDLAGVKLSGGPQPDDDVFVPAHFIGDRDRLPPAIHIRTGFDRIRRYWVGSTAWNDERQSRDYFYGNEVGPFASMRDVERMLTKEWPNADFSAWMPN